MPLTLTTRTSLALAVVAAQTLAHDRNDAGTAIPPQPRPVSADSAVTPASAETTAAMPRIALHFTAPADPAGAGAVRRYEFLQVDPLGNSTLLHGYADSTGATLLAPHAPGTRETVWLAPTQPGLAKTIFVLSRGANGSASARSNGVPIAAVLHPRAGARAAHAGRLSLRVPIVRSQPGRSGEAALAMVMGYYARDGRTRPLASPALHAAATGIHDLAAVAHQAGYRATVETLTLDELIALVQSRVPPIVRYRSATHPGAVDRFGVVTGWDSLRHTFTLHDGGERGRVLARADLARRWQTAGSQALVLRLDPASTPGAPAGP